MQLSCRYKTVEKEGWYSCEVYSVRSVLSLLGFNARHTHRRHQVCVSEDTLSQSSPPEVFCKMNWGRRKTTDHMSMIGSLQHHWSNHKVTHGATVELKFESRYGEKCPPSFSGFRLIPVCSSMWGGELLELEGMVPAQFVGGGVSSLPHSLDPANPGWCGVIGASEETRTRATQRTVVMEITQSYLPEWPFFTLFSSNVFFFVSLCEQRELFHCVWSREVTNFSLRSIFPSIQHYQWLHFISFIWF